MEEQDATPEPDATETSPPEVAIEHEPTISYVPPGSADAGSGASERVRGAFGYALVVERGPRAGMAYVLATGSTTFGRDPESGIFLDDVTVSRYHGSFVVEGGRIYVEDNRSTNGTYVNSERVERAELEPGDEVIIGKYHLVVASGDA